MPRVRYTAEGGHYRIDGHGFDPGDERDVDADLAAYLNDHDDFEVVDDDVVDGDQSDTDTDVDETESEDDEDEFDASAFLDRNVGPVVDDIEAGDVDEHLDTVAETADRVTVQDAIGERRAELEG